MLVSSYHHCTHAIACLHSCIWDLSRALLYFGFLSHLNPLLKVRDGKCIKVVPLWRQCNRCHGWPMVGLPWLPLGNRLVCCMTPTLQRIIDKLKMFQSKMNRKSLILTQRKWFFALLSHILTQEISDLVKFDPIHHPQFLLHQVFHLAKMA